MKITPNLFHAYLKCPTKCWLLAAGEASTDNPYAEWVKSQTDSYRTTATERMVGASPTDALVRSPGAENLKAAQWRLATSLTAQAQIDSASLESELHAVERIPSAGRGKAAQFVPIRFIFRNKLTTDDKLVLAFDAFVLFEMLGREISLGKIIHGDDHATLKVKTLALAGTVRKHLAKITALLSNPVPPDLVLNRHCAECEFQARCRKIAVEKDDLSLLANMSAKERQKLRSKGIFTVTQLSYTFRPRRRPKKLRDKREKDHHSLKALAIREKKIHIVGCPELKIEGTPVYLDVEGLPDRDFYYLIGVRIGNGDSGVQHSLWADTIADEGRIWREFLGILETVEKPVLIHYGSYETTFLKEMNERHGSPAEDSENAKTIAAAVNAISILFGIVYFPTYANGLKDLAAYMGFKWSEAESAGLASIIWRFAWEESKSAHFREKLITYNAQDCQALAILVRAIAELGSKQEAGKPNGGFAANTVQAEAIRPATKWGNFSSPFPEFEKINQAARWYYQRDRVYARTGKKMRKVLKEETRRPRKPERVNKVVTDPDALPCPHCGCVSLRDPKLRTITLEDIFFGRNSLKWLVVEHRYHRYWCPSCGVNYGSPRGFWPRSKFGRNLVAYILYHVIELAIPQLAVKRSLDRLFGYRMQQCALSRIKAKAGQIYQDTRRMILEKIVRGSLVHVDETRANARGRSAYVWVFTSLHEVAYLYSDSREGEIAQKTLSAFNGVLVSDFYAAYDSFACSQQKCLIHLMRDLNDEILDRPFDEELKRIVMAFAAILKPMIETVDRYGLKKYFLRKHLKHVEHFYRQIDEIDTHSEAALKCKDRFQKNRGKLFTFLEHDGIPWNNNNAEHAIKAFAAIREGIEGSSTAKGLDDYLILLSVCQTCKYMGVDFLDFLRSGEKDIHAFAESQQRRRRRTQTSPPSGAPANSTPPSGDSDAGIDGECDSSQQVLPGQG